MPALRTYHLFISHCWDYNDEYYRLIDYLKDTNNFNFKNFSVPEHDRLDTTTAKELRDALHNQIRPTHVVLILAGMYVNHRQWIQEEINIAKSLSKPIIAIKPWGNTLMPTVVQDCADEIVGWNTSSIVAAIRKVSL
ncbi:MAG TPA: nuclease [Clostridiaceae bacterium]|jgi:hypothetical protein|nr:nuclease [Clostridiaceae bacterium]